MDVKRSEVGGGAPKGLYSSSFESPVRTNRTSGYLQQFMAAHRWDARCTATMRLDLFHKKGPANINKIPVIAPVEGLAMLIALQSAESTVCRLTEQSNANLRGIYICIEE